MFGTIIGIAKPVILAALFSYFSPLVGAVIQSMKADLPAFSQGLSPSPQSGEGKTDIEQASLIGVPSQLADINRKNLRAIVCVSKKEACSRPASYDDAKVYAVVHQNDGTYIALEHTAKWDAAMNILETPNDAHKADWKIIYAEE